MLDSINSSYQNNMATVVKSVSEFTGSDTENVEEWLKTVLMMCKMGDLCDRDMVRVTIFALRVEREYGQRH
jgi:glycosyltransferase A (GT-A) superfamily protein (DUF2064 family)